MHPMKPHRMKMADSLIRSYGMNEMMTEMEMTESYKEDFDMTKFHADDYIDFLREITPENVAKYSDQLLRFNIGEDCPIFDGLYDFCSLYSQGSVLGSVYLNQDISDIAINWCGGLHHAKKHEASGFCYINDCVLGILELLKRHQRVLYIDIDIHHGDGVEEAFYTTDRVMTASFHKFGEYFPGTGAIEDVGYEKGKNYSMNFPLSDGMDDEHFEYVFKPVIDEIFLRFRPEAALLQCGADSLSGDRLGCFNLSVRGHGNCVEYIKGKNVPILVVGGGGYTLRNVPRWWTYETSVWLGYDLPNEIPEDNEYREYFWPEYKIHMPCSNMENLNSREDLDKKIGIIFENLRSVSATSVDLSNFKNGGSQVPDHMDFDQSKERDIKEDRDQDINTDNKS